MCQIVSCEEIEGYGAFYIVDCEPVGLIACILADGAQFTQSDWQGEQCREADDIAEYHWLDPHGNAAVMLDGLPRMFA